MAKTAAKRRSPAKRKPAAGKSSGLALSGWIVAAGLGAAWAGPQLGLWPHDVLDRIPSFDQVRAMVSRDETAPRRIEAPERPKIVARAEEARPVEPPAKRPTLPPLTSETIADIVRKADAKPTTPLPKPQPRAPAPAHPSALLPPGPVPEAIPVITAAIRKEPPQRPTTARPGDLAIRRYPFTTAPAVAYVGDLRTLRILGGEGDWKKVEVSATGTVGWLRLQRLREAPQNARAAVPATDAPVPAEALLQEPSPAKVR